MVDIVDIETRKRMMSGIKNKHTKIEIIVRKSLFAKGFRYRINDTNLPGKPDLVLPKHNAIIFIHGCFWHKHSCSLFRLPSSNQEFWHAKIDGNVARDIKTVNQLTATGWRIAVVWECSLRGKKSLGIKSVSNQLETWLNSGCKNYIEIKS